MKNERKPIGVRVADLVDAIEATRLASQLDRHADRLEHGCKLMLSIADGNTHYPLDADATLADAVTTVIRLRAADARLRATRLVGRQVSE